MNSSIAAVSSAAIAAEEINAGPGGIFLMTAFFACTPDTFTDKLHIRRMVIEEYGREIAYA
jgi:hypothetical protein